jgi:hypothetical protein
MIRMHRLGPVLLAAALIGAVPRVATAADADTLFQEGARLYHAGDMAAAAKAFAAAAEAGDVRAQLQIGWHYENGAGVPQDYATAAAWYRRAAEQGNATAAANLGLLYERGEGVPEDWGEAARWYRRAAEQNDIAGLSRLSRAYRFGIGVPQSRREAIAWAQRAAALGDQQSAEDVRWRSDPTNNIGFRNQAERDMVIGNRMVVSVVHNEAAGMLFHNAAEREQFLAGVARQLAADQAYSFWLQRQTTFQLCMQRHQGYCINPGPPPPH